MPANRESRHGDRPQPFMLELKALPVVSGIKWHRIPMKRDGWTKKKSYFHKIEIKSGKKIVFPTLEHCTRIFVQWSVLP